MLLKTICFERVKTDEGEMFTAISLKGSGCFTQYKAYRDALTFNPIEVVVKYLRLFLWV